MILGIFPALWGADSRWTARKACQAFGHQFSWRYAVKNGVLDRQVCSTCKAEWPPR